jgi:hypothetical protein
MIWDVFSIPDPGIKKARDQKSTGSRIRNILITFFKNESKSENKQALRGISEEKG